MVKIHSSKRFLILNLFSLLLLGSVLTVYGQPAIHGAKTIASSAIVNEYAYLTADASLGSKTITVNNAGLNANSRFSSILSAGDLLMVIQMQGVSISSVNDSSWGAIVSYGNCGLYEFAQVASVAGSIITLDCNLLNNYSAVGKTQVVRIPRYASLTINSGGILTADPWNGQTGGILAVEVEGNTIVNSGGKLDVTGKGFRGGQTLDNNYDFAVTDYVNTSDFKGAEKGEGVAGYKTDYDTYGGRYCRGAAANGGGGGNSHTSGGGGGANAGIVSAWNGKGNPDISKPGYITAWNLESVGFANSTSSGGGRGGYNWSGSTANPTVNGPGNYATWGGDSRWNHGGLGGRPLDYASGRIFMGGGGGAGEQNDTRGGKGGEGGGLIYMICSGNVSGAGQILANGNNGTDTGLGSFTNSGTDAAGGAGGGGTIMINSKGTISSVSLFANGGTGGNQKLFLNPFSLPKEAEGPGGGGGGGYIGISSGTPSMQVLGGNNGITNSPTFTLFPPDGATKGGAGISSSNALLNFGLIPYHAKICPGNTASLSITTSGIAPPLSAFIWYDQALGGNIVATGANFVTPVLNASKNYFVSTCPGFRRDTVKAIVNPPAIAKAGNDTTICKGSSVSLIGSGGVSYSWTPSSGLNNAVIANPTASPLSSTTYVLTITDVNGCQSKDSVLIKLDSILLVNAGPDQAICKGNSVTLNAGTGGSIYTWSPATGLSSSSVFNPIASPSTTIAYTLTVSNASGCSGKDTVLVTVNPLPVAAAGNDTSICVGSSIQLNGSGGATYSWSPSTGLNNPAIANPMANPVSNIAYTLTVTSAAGCKATDVVNITTGVKLSVYAGRDTSICPGNSIQLLASGGQTYTWSPASSLNNPGIANPIASPSGTTTYLVNASNANACQGIDSVKITVMPPFTVSAGLNDSICSGNSIQLNGSGANYYIWSPASSLSNGFIANPIATPLSDTYYSLIGVDNAGCMSKDTVQIKVLSAFPASIFLNGNSTICMGDSVQLNATPGAASYAWSPSLGLSASNVNDPYAHPMINTHYVLTVMSSNGCPSKDSVDLVVRPLPIADAGPNQTICNGIPAQLQASGGVHYLWLPATHLSDPTISNPIASPDSSFTYFVLVNDNFCSSADSVQLTVISSQGTIHAGYEQAIYKGSSVKLQPWGGTSYHWSPETFLDCQNCENPLASPKSSMWFFVDALDANGCKVKDSVYVSVIDGVSVYVPSTFSPNRDGKNDVFVVSGFNIKEFSMIIYNRWGNSIYESNNPFEGWDGTFQGNEVQEGNYVYIIHVITDAGGAYDRVGSVNLIR